MTERIKKEVKSNDDELLSTKTEISRFLIDLKYEKEYILHEIF